MKKILALIVVLSLLLCGCGGSQPPAGEVTPQTEAPTEAQPEEKPLSMGRIEGGVYTNTYAGFGCQLDEHWTFYSAQELQQLPDQVYSAIEGSDMETVMADYPQIFDLQAENAEDLLAVNVVYTKVSLQERLVYAALNEEETVDATLEQSDMIIESYAQAGMEVESMEKVKLTFLGEEHYGIRTVAQSNGIPIYMLQVMNFDLGLYGVNLTATSYVEDNVQSVLDMFYVVE